MNRSDLKFRAKMQLGGGVFSTPWLVAAVAGIIVGVLCAAVNAIVPALGTLVITGPLSYGTAYLFLKQSRDNEPMNLADLFRGFTEDLAQNIILGLAISIFTALWSMLFVIPGIVKGISYSMAFYIKVDHPEYDWRQCLEASKIMTMGRKMDLFLLELSFFGWLLLGSALFGVGVFLVIPYMTATTVQYYNDIKDQY